MSSIWTVRRSATDAKVAGLCGGVAEHWGIDPVLVRVAWVLLALSGGVGLVLYLAGWLLIPVQGRDTAPADDLLGDTARRWPKEVWVVLVVAACLAVSGAFGKAGPFGVGPAVAIACIWYFGFAKHRRTGKPTGPAGGTGTAPLPPAAPSFIPHPGPSTPFTVAAESWRRRIEEHAERSATPGPATGSTGSPGVVPAAVPADVQDPDPEWTERSAFLAQPDPVGLYVDPPAGGGGAQALPVRRGAALPARRLRLLTLLVLGLTVGGLTLADRSGVGVTPAVYAASALLVVGLALVAATWVGRARGLLPLGLLLVPVVVVTTVLGPASPREPWQATRFAPTSLAELPSAAKVQPRGELVADLSRIRVDQDTTFTAHVGIGHLEVVVPRDANVALNYRVQRGVVTTYAEDLRVGPDLAGVTPPLAPIADVPTLTLNLSVDRGLLEVRK